MVFLTMKKPLVLELDDNVTATVERDGVVELNDGDIVYTNIDELRRLVAAYDARPKPLTADWEDLHPGVRVRKNCGESVMLRDSLDMRRDIVLTISEMQGLIARLGEEEE